MDTYTSSAEARADERFQDRLEIARDDLKDTLWKNRHLLAKVACESLGVAYLPDYGNSQIDAVVDDLFEAIKDSDWFDEIAHEVAGDI